MERRFEREPKLELAYYDFMATYVSMGQMERVPGSETCHPHAWYLSHHAVIQSSPTSWKVRVVFNVSRRIRIHGSLNNYLIPGPELQSYLSLIITNWKRHRFVFTADIVKIFHQVLIHQQIVICNASCGPQPLVRRQPSTAYRQSPTARHMNHSSPLEPWLS